MAFKDLRSFTHAFNKYIGLSNCHLISSFKKRVESTSEEDGQLQRGLCLNQKYSNGERMLVQGYYNDMFLSPFINPIHSLYPMSIRSHIFTKKLYNISESILWSVSGMTISF